MEFRGKNVYGWELQGVSSHGTSTPRRGLEYCRPWKGLTLGWGSSRSLNLPHTDFRAGVFEG